MRDDLVAFLAIWGKPSAAELRLWEAALAPLGDKLIDVLASWLRRSAAKPHPNALIQIYATIALHNPMRDRAEQIALQHGITIEDLLGGDRTARVSTPRQRLMSELHADGHSYAKIGNFLSRDHSTIVHGVRAWRAQ